MEYCDGLAIIEGWCIYGLPLNDYSDMIGYFNNYIYIADADTVTFSVVVAM